jgi:hypothetical protein
MKAYPLGIDNPILIRADFGTTTWSLYWREQFVKIASFPNQFAAYDARRSILKSMGYNV